MRLERSFGVGLPDQRVLDIGTGTGTVARQMPTSSLPALHGGL